MSTSPLSPRLARAGLVVLDAASGAVQRVITLQYNPDSLSRSIQARSASGDTGDPGEALRLTGPPVETISLEAEFDVTDQLEDPENNATEVELGLLPKLASLEQLLYPPSAQIQQNDALARGGTVEVLPLAGPLLVFVWSADRVLPVRLTELSITEEAFNTDLRPIRARVSLSFRVLSAGDLGLPNRGGSLAMAHHMAIESLAARTQSGTLEDFGLGGLP